MCRDYRLIIFDFELDAASHERLVNPCSSPIMHHLRLHTPKRFSLIPGQC